VITKQGRGPKYITNCPRIIVGKEVGWGGHWGTSACPLTRSQSL